MRHGSHLEVQPLEKLTIAQLGQLRGRQRFQRCGGDPVKALQPGLAMVHELDVDSHRLEQIQLRQLPGERVGFLRSAHQRGEHGCDALQVLGWLSAIVKQPLAFVRLNLGAAHIDRNIQRALTSSRSLAATRNQRERLPLDL